MGALIFIVTALLIAALGGAFNEILGAALCGGITYLMVRGVLDAVPSTVEKVQRARLEAETESLKAATSDEKRLASVNRQNEATLASIEATTREQTDGNSDVALCCGVAVFAYPPLIVAALIGWLCRFKAVRAMALKPLSLLMIPFRPFITTLRRVMEQ